MRYAGGPRAHKVGISEMRTPENQGTELGVISDEEPEENGLQRRRRRTYRSRNWVSRVPWLTRTGVNGKKLPPVGRFCLILKGDADKDVGRMGMVTRQTKSMVSIVWKDELTGRVREKLKHPESLIQLEEGLRVEQDADGMLWVVRDREAEE
jgi:hypothetical protein